MGRRQKMTLRDEMWYKEAAEESTSRRFNLAVEQYSHTGELSYLMEVLKLSLRSGSGISGTRSENRTTARELLYDHILHELRSSLPDNVYYQGIPAKPVALGKSGPWLLLRFPAKVAGNRKVEVEIKLYPLIQHSFENIYPTVSLTNIRHGTLLSRYSKDLFIDPPRVDNLIAVIRKVVA